MFGFMFFAASEEPRHFDFPNATSFVLVWAKVQVDLFHNLQADG
jgi:hypothetical protein